MSFAGFSLKLLNFTHYLFTTIMIKSIFALAILVALTSSCALNKIFLHPFPLKTTDSYSDYNKDLKDTLTLTFKADQSPIVKNSTNEIAALDYSIENIHFLNQQEDTLNAWFIKPNSVSHFTFYMETQEISFTIIY